MEKQEFKNLKVGDIITAATDSYVFTTKSKGWKGKVVGIEGLYINAETITPNELKGHIYEMLYYPDFALDGKERPSEPVKREIPQLTDEEALAVFKDMENPEHTAEAKIEAVNVVSKITTNNAFTKAQLINAIKWLYANCDMQPKGV